MNEFREKDHWRWRRLVVFAITLTSVSLPFCPDVNSDVFWPFYTLALASIGAYIGFATAEDIYGQRHQFRKNRVDNPDI